MNHIGRHLGPLGYKVIKVPPLSSAAMQTFENLPQDPYYGERWRRFSQYLLFYEYDRWACRVLRHAPLVLAKAYGPKVGGVQRFFEPTVDLDPTPQIAELAGCLRLEKNEICQVDLHQWRTRIDEKNSGVTVPEGPHRDGHHVSCVIVWSRSNIEGGESLLYEIGKTEPFWTRVLQPGEALILRDEDLVHSAGDIRALSADGGHRDIWVVCINPWSDRRYGDTFESYAAASIEDSSATT
jgi:hypothetical protein